MKRASRHLLGGFILAGVFAGGLAGCTKARNAALPDSKLEETFAISDLQGATYEVTTGNKVIPVAASDIPSSSLSEKPKVEVGGLHHPRPVETSAHRQACSLRLGHSASSAF